MRSFLSLITLSTSITTSTFALPDSYQVNTTNGLIIGHAAKNRTNVVEFLGIKFGQAPVGDLRFAPPTRYAASTDSVYNASEWSADCPHNKAAISTFPNFTEPSGLKIWKTFAAQNNNPISEDCLALNIWTKSLNPEEKKPVIVFLHGGRFIIPGPHSPYYNGQYLTDTEDVVIVTANYRLGIFGFPGAPDIQQNAAILDQRLAIEWIRDNAEAFGGDPSRIIFSGQSAGGAAIDYYSFAWKDDPIVAGVMLLSSTAFSFSTNTAAFSQSLWYNVSQAIGCGGTTDDIKTVTACMQTANISAILAASAKFPGQIQYGLGQAAFRPTVDNTTVFDNYTTLSAAGAFAKVPMVASNTDYESGWYKLGAYASKTNLTEAQWDEFDQGAFTCANAYTANDRVKYGVPTWRYRYHADWDNLRLYNESAGLGPKGSAAYHGTDLTMIFGTAEDVSDLKSSGDEDALSKYVMGAYAAFARDPVKGLSEYGWPKYTENDGVLVRLGVGNSPGADFVDAGLYDDVCFA